MAITDIDEQKLEAFIGHAATEVGAALNVALVSLGHELGLYRAMADGQPVTPAELADRTGTQERFHTRRTRCSGSAAPRATRIPPSGPASSSSAGRCAACATTSASTTSRSWCPSSARSHEARRVVELLAQNGLERGRNGLKLIMMCELPTNALLAREFLEHFDGMSIGSNDMTQLTLGIDRDSAIVAPLFDERDPAVKALLAMAIKACKESGKYIGICGQGPSDHPDLARWLVDQGIDSLSLNPDTVVETWLYLANGAKR